MTEPDNFWTHSKPQAKLFGVDIKAHMPYYSIDEAAMVAANMIFKEVLKNSKREYGIAIYSHKKRGGVFYLTDMRIGSLGDVYPDHNQNVMIPITWLPSWLATLLRNDDWEFEAHVHSHPIVYLSNPFQSMFFNKKELYEQVFSLADYALYYEYQCTGYLVAALHRMKFNNHIAFVQCEIDRESSTTLTCPIGDPRTCSKSPTIKCNDLICADGTKMRFRDGLLMKFSPPSTKYNPTITIKQEYLERVNDLLGSESSNINNIEAFEMVDMPLFESVPLAWNTNNERDMFEIIEETKKRQIFNHSRYGVTVTPIVSNSEKILFKKINYPMWHPIQTFEEVGYLTHSSDWR
jgi:hypothetical protein